MILDVTVLAYAVADGHPLRSWCGALLAGVADRRLAAGTTAEVVQELLHIHGRRVGRARAVALVRDQVELVSPLLSVGAAELLAGADLFATCEQLGAFDAVLAALAVARDEPLVSADGSFALVPGLRYLDPVAAVKELLG